MSRFEDFQLPEKQDEEAQTDLGAILSDPHQQISRSKNPGTEQLPGEINIGQIKIVVSAPEGQPGKGDKVENELDKVSEKLGKKLFETAEQGASAGDAYFVEKSGGWNTQLTFHFNRFGKPEPVVLKGDVTTATASLDEKAFDYLVLKPAIIDSMKDGRFTPRHDVKLALKSGNETVGTFFVQSWKANS